MTTAYGPPWGGIEGGTAGASSSPTAGGPRLYTGKQVYAVAVDPRLFPYGTKLRIPDNPFGDPNAIFTAVDTGGAIKGKHIDFFIAEPNKANNWLKRGSVVEVVGRGSVNDIAAPGRPGRSAGSGPIARAARAGTPASLEVQGGSQGGGIAQLLAASMQQTSPQPVASSGLADPSFSSRKSLALPTGYQDVQSSAGGPVARDSGMDAALAAISQIQQPQVNVNPGSAGTPASGGGGSSPAAAYKNYKGYVNPAPLGVSADFSGRVDQGKDATIARGHSILAIGNAKITNIQTGVQGFGTVVYYKLLDGPYKGRVVFQGHAGKPLVNVGQRVRAGQAIQVSYGNEGGPGHIEIGWGSPDSSGTLARSLGHVDPSSHYSPEGQSIADLIAKLPRVRRR